MTQLIDHVQSAGSWAWVPCWHVGEEIPSLNVIIKIQLGLGPSSISPMWGLEAPEMDIYDPAACKQQRHAAYLWLLETQCRIQACEDPIVRSPRILPPLEPPLPST